MSSRPTYSDEFKADAVALAESSGRLLALVAAELGISQPCRAGARLSVFLGTIRIDPDDRERKDGHDELQGFEDPFGGLVPHGRVDRPTRGNSSNWQGKAVLAGGVPAVIGEKIDLDNTRHGTE